MSIATQNSFITVTIHMRSNLALIASLFFLIYSLSSNAYVTSEKHVQLYHDAMDALSNNEHQQFNSIVDALGDHPLAGYTQYQYLSGRIGSEKTSTLKKFLNKYGYLKVSSEIRQELLNRAYKRNYWQDIIDAYDPVGSGTIANCEYLAAKLHQGTLTEDDQELLVTIWTKGKSQPDACDDAFTKAKGTIITKELVWKRIENAVRKKNYKFASYLGRTWLNGTNVAALIEARKDAIAYLSSSISNPKKDKGRYALVLALEYLSVDDPEKSLNNFNIIRKKYGLNSNDLNYLVTRLCYRLSINHHKESLEVCDHGDNSFIQDYETESEWRMRAAIRHSDWQRLINYYGGLNKTQQESTTWQYWYARALKQTGQEALATKIFTNIAKDRSLEGYLAANYLGLPYNFNSKPVSQRIEELGHNNNLASNDALEIVKALVAIDQPLAAKEQLVYSVMRIDEVSQLLLSDYAFKQQWYLQAILAISKAGYYDDLEIRFPLPHKLSIQNYAKERGLPDYWVAALIRQESIFTHDIRSSAGAVGLMQIMPATGRLVARKIGVRKPSSNDLTKPDLNIKLGSWYIKDLWQELGDRVRATAGYNAGPSRSRSWSKDVIDIPVDNWIETIPFNETRNYVKRVMTYATIYAGKLDHNDFNLAAFITPTHNKSPLAATTIKAASLTPDYGNVNKEVVAFDNKAKTPNKQKIPKNTPYSQDIEATPSISQSVPKPLPRKLIKPFGVPLENEQNRKKQSEPSNIINY